MICPDKLHDVYVQGHPCSFYFDIYYYLPTSGLSSLAMNTTLMRDPEPAVPTKRPAQHSKTIHTFIPKLANQSLSPNETLSPHSALHDGLFDQCTLARIPRHHFWKKSDNRRGR
jgi:hypothetical protein